MRTTPGSQVFCLPDFVGPFILWMFLKQRTTMEPRAGYKWRPCAQYMNRTSTQDIPQESHEKREEREEEKQ